jgi:hypothetical protein
LLVVAACGEILFVVVYTVVRGVLDGDTAEALLAVPAGALQAAPFVLALWLPRDAVVGAIATAAMLALTTSVFIEVLGDDPSTVGGPVLVAIAGVWVIWAIALGVELALGRWARRRAAHVPGQGSSLVDRGGGG